MHAVIEFLRRDRLAADLLRLERELRQVLARTGGSERSEIELGGS